MFDLAIVGNWLSSMAALGAALSVRSAMRDGNPLLAQPMRRNILSAIRSQPGIKISEICRTTGAGWGTVQHHLHLLRKAGLVVSRPAGRDHFHFPSEVPARELALAEVLLQGRAQNLADAIAETPGASQKELCGRVHMTRKIIRRYVGLLAKAGLVTERREAGHQRYYPEAPLIERRREETKPPGWKENDALAGHAGTLAQAPP